MELKGSVEKTGEGDLFFVPEELDTDPTRLRTVTEITMDGKVYVVAVTHGTVVFFLEQRGDQLQFANSNQIKLLEKITAN